MKKYISLAVMLSLMDGKCHKAVELAEAYETSTKTIYRSIESLLAAGIPITSELGRKGGFKILNASKINSGFFTSEELANFLSFAFSNQKKLEGSFFAPLEERLKNSLSSEEVENLLDSSNHLIIDTDVWGDKCSEASLKNIIDSAIKTRSKLDLTYKSEKSAARTIHPYALVFKNGAWYLYAYCENKKDFRMFRLSRITKIKKLDQCFEKQKHSCILKPWNFSFEQNHDKIEVSLLVKKDRVSEIMEWLSSSIILSHELMDNFLIKAILTYSYGLVHRLMSYGDSVIILSPKSLALDLQNECKKIFDSYKFA